MFSIIQEILSLLILKYLSIIYDRPYMYNFPLKNLHVHNSMHVHRWRRGFNSFKITNWWIETVLKFIGIQMAYSLTKTDWKYYKNVLNSPLILITLTLKMTLFRYEQNSKGIRISNWKNDTSLRAFYKSHVHINDSTKYLYNIKLYFPI